MTKNKIAILTQPLGHNYGGIIQNYALQKILKAMGHLPITIDRRESVKKSKFRIVLIQLKREIFKNIFKKNILTTADIKKIKENNFLFLNKHVTISPRIDSTSLLKDYFQKENFSAVIVGSDQTWRPKYSPDIYNYYLDFLEDNKTIKKLAYASSFGTADWEYTHEQTDNIKELITQFDAISVREGAGVELCKKKLDVDAVHLLDPTLLLTAEDYSKLLNRSKENKELFTYVLDESEEKQDFINSIGRQLNLKQHTSQAKKYNPNVKRSLNELIMPPLENWLQGFRDAEFIITDSFHGTVFSIINKKPFVSLVNVERGASRFESILSKLGLEDRMIYDVNSYDNSIIKQDIDYEIVHQKLNNLKEESLNFLNDNL